MGHRVGAPSRNWGGGLGWLSGVGSGLEVFGGRDIGAVCPGQQHQCRTGPETQGLGKQVPGGGRAPVFP